MRARPSKAKAMSLCFLRDESEELAQDLFVHDEDAQYCISIAREVYEKRNENGNEGELETERRWIN